MLFYLSLWNQIIVLLLNFQFALHALEKSTLKSFKLTCNGGKLRTWIERARTEDWTIMYFKIDSTLGFGEDWLRRCIILLSTVWLLQFYLRHFRLWFHVLTCSIDFLDPSSRDSFLLLVLLLLRRREIEQDGEKRPGKVPRLLLLIKSNAFSLAEEPRRIEICSVTSCPFSSRTSTVCVDMVSHYQRFAAMRNKSRGGMVLATQPSRQLGYAQQRKFLVDGANGTQDLAVNL